MPDRELVSAHYTHGSLVDAITAGMSRLGKTIATVSIDDLGPVDEFHVGGRVATENLLDQLDIQAKHDVLDVGCGLGGASRFAAARYNCLVTGIDLTAEYVETGDTLCAWVGLAERARSQEGPPPLGIHIFMGNSAPLKVKNMIGNTASNLLAPVELVAAKPSCS